MMSCGFQVNVSWNSISSFGCSYISEGVGACRWLQELKIGHNWYTLECAFFATRDT